MAPENIPTSLLSHAHRLKAEALLAHIIGEGYPREDFAVGTGDFFQRAYHNDVTGAEFHEDEWLNGMIHVQLSRPGFYDMLPEGLFFQPAGVEYNNAMGVPEMAALYRWNRTREKGVRRFFQPFEHAGFYQQLQLEEEEKSLLRELEKGALHRYFRTFWDLPAEMDDNAAGYLILLIPYAHRIVGCLSFMQRCLALLLDETVEIRVMPPTVTLIEGQLGLGGQTLGNDMVCGSSFFEGYPVYKYIIGPLEQEKVSAYLPEGDRYIVLETFNRFFVPAEAGTVTEIEIDRTRTEMRLEPGNEPLLGYSSILTV
ncbi:MAG: type VI secretion system baseplate subunit TssG [Chitinophagaceae bacterium]|nr:type VI secretion system baseplate subunit TssG [Chitinophagaceae bacterium]